MKPLLPLLAVGLLALAFTASAEKSPTSGGHDIRQFKLGPHLFGPQLTATTMQGKAVMLDCWGIHCPPCLAMMPEVEGIAKEYANKLVMVGVHSQENNKSAVEAVVKKNSLSYTIVQGVNSPVKFEMLPHVFLFDAKGEMVFDGSPFDKEFKPALHKAVNSVSAGAAATPSALDALIKQNATPAPTAPAGATAPPALTR